jgi:hypothetical protein
MAKGRLFTYAVLHHPKVMKDGAGNEIQEKSSILAGPTSIVAFTDAEVQITASRSIPDNYLDKLEQVEIIVRPL